MILPILARMAACLGLALAASTPLASGPSIADADLKITLTLPDGFERVADYEPPPGFDIRYAFRRLNSEGQAAVWVYVQRLSGSLGRERIPEEAVKKSGAAGHYVEKWKSFDVDVFLVNHIADGQALVTRNVQVPIKLCAVQLRVVGPESQDAELAEVTRQLLASLDGPTNWLTDEERIRLGLKACVQTVAWLLAVGACVLGLTAWRTACFRKTATALGLPRAWARQKVRPSWAWYLVPAYLLLAGFLTALALVCWHVLYDAPRVLLWQALGVFSLSIVVALVPAGLIMRRRVRTKRRILAGPPPAAPPA